MKKQQEVREMNSITYSFVDGTKQVQPINKEVYFGERGRKRSFYEILDVFKSTASDKGAINFTIDAETENTIERPVNESFTAKEKYRAKKDYKEFKKNTAVFSKERSKFLAYIADKFSGKLRFNLVQVGMLK